jgi:hypothetical protein
MKALIKHVDKNFKRSSYTDIFKAFPPILMLLVTLGIFLSLAVASLGSTLSAQWPSFLVSMVAILTAYYSFIMASRKYANKRLAYREAKRLSALLPDKSEEALVLLPPLVSIRMENYPVKLQDLYEVDKKLFLKVKLIEYYYLN